MEAEKLYLCEATKLIVQFGHTAIEHSCLFFIDGKFLSRGL